MPLAGSNPPVGKASYARMAAKPKGARWTAGTVAQRTRRTAQRSDSASSARSRTEDIAELRPQLDTVGQSFAADAQDRLSRRGEDEARKLRDTLERQRDHVAAELSRHDAQFRQLTLAFMREEARQLDADIEHWRRRVAQFEKDLEEEPERIRSFYEVQATRIEPVGIVYLWPETN